MSNSQIVNILGNVSELQSYFCGDPAALEVMDKLANIREASLSLMQRPVETIDDVLQQSRTDVLDKIEIIWMLSTFDRTLPIPDSDLIRLGAVADDLAIAVRNFVETRNKAVSMQMAAMPEV